MQSCIQNSLLAGIFIATLLIQSSICRPIVNEDTASLQRHRRNVQSPVVFTIHSANSGMFLKMNENDSVSATGNCGGQGALWLIHFIEDKVQFENYHYRNHYLVVEKRGEVFSLLSHNYTEQEVEVIQSSETTSMAVVDEGSTASGSSLVERAHNWVHEPTAIVTSRLSIDVDDTTCYLSFDTTGQPRTDFCSTANTDDITLDVFREGCI